MSEHEGDEARAVYDIEVEDPRLTGRRRAVADWGVGEELFDRMPRRRFRSGEAHRRDVHRTGRFEPVERDEPRERRPRPVDEAPPRETAEEQSRRERLEDALERFEPRVDEALERLDDSAEPEPVEEPPAPAIEPIDPVAPPASLPVADDVARPPEGRRTVVIRGRGAEPAWTPRRRPPRTVGERLGPRPDRVAAWAVALGMLLILIAILTAHG